MWQRKGQMDILQRQSPRYAYALRSKNSFTGHMLRQLPMIVTRMLWDCLLYECRQRCSEDTELNQAKSKPDNVNRPVRTARTVPFKHHYYIAQYCNTERVWRKGNIVKTTITSQMWPSGGNGKYVWCSSHQWCSPWGQALASRHFEGNFYRFGLQGPGQPWPWELHWPFFGTIFKFKKDNKIKNTN